MYGMSIARRRRRVQLHERVTCFSAIHVVSMSPPPRPRTHTLPSPYREDAPIQRQPSIHPRGALPPLSPRGGGQRARRVMLYFIQWSTAPDFAHSMLAFNSVGFCADQSLLLSLRRTRRWAAASRCVQTRSLAPAASCAACA